jgi:K+-sensing histidine kinase KdpD
MDRDTDGGGRYINKVRDETTRYIRELLGEVDNLRGKIERFEGENRDLHKRLAMLELELENYRSTQFDLQQELVRIEAAKRRFLEQYRDVEQENNNLANLYVASYRLHQTLERPEVLAIIQEILINLLGTEEIGIFETEPDGAALKLISFFGIDGERYSSIRIGEGIIGGVVASSQPYFGKANGKSSQRTEPDVVTACIPLKVDNTVMGAIAVFRLLDHKAGLEPIDHELLDLLATHAATALLCTRLYASERESAAEREPVSTMV